jgi:hypothetical protein
MSWRWNVLDMLQRLAHVMKELISYETWHEVMWLRWRRSKQDLAWWTGCKSEGQVEDLASMVRGNGEEQVKSRSMNQHGHVMIWSGSYHLVIGWCMCCINIEGDGMECLRQRYNLRAFYLTGHRCVEKFMTRFRIDGRTIKRGKLICISVI